MNLKNNSFNYAKKYKSICKYLAIALPLLLLLIACIFPTKQINNTYALEETTTTQEIQYKYNQLDLSDNDITWNNINNNEIFNLKIINDTLDSLLNGDFYYEIKIINILNISFHNYMQEISIDDLSYPMTNQDLILYIYGYETYLYIGDMNTYICLSIGDLSEYTFTLDIDCILNDTNSDININYNYIKETPLNRIPYDSINNITNNTYNQETLTQVNETKQPNEVILQPLNLLYKANINSWYDTFLTAFELNYEDNNYMYYLVHYPLYILYVVLLDLLLDIILLVPCLLHRLVHKYKGDD